MGKLSAGRNHERASATLEEQTKTWWHDEGVGLYESFPDIFFYSIWEAHNMSIFNNTWTPPDITISLLMNKIQEHNLNTVISKKRMIKAPIINNETPWSYSDGAS